MDEVLAEFCCGATTTQPNMLGAHVHLFEPFDLFKLSSFTINIEFVADSCMT